jgi:hypothetical protein
MIILKNKDNDICIANNYASLFAMFTHMYLLAALYILMIFKENRKGKNLRAINNTLIFCKVKTIM